jgi:serine carboxypeptidase-like clade 2
LNPAVKVWLYNGDWDDVVPYPDTLKNLKKLSVRASGAWSPWFTGIGDEHAGFFQVYRGLQVITVKGAGHMVPQNKRQASFQMFFNFIKNRPLNTPVY